MRGPKSRLSHSQLLILTGFFVHCYNNLSYRFLDSFLPKHAQSVYGLSEVMIGVLFASFCMAIFVSSPIWGTICNKWGPKSIVCYGLLIEAVALICLSFPSWISKDYIGATTFSVLFSFLRAFEGFGSAAAQTGCYAMLASASGSSGESSGAGMGGMEMFGGIGNMLGPLIGAALASRNESSPFYFMGILGFVVCAITRWALPTKQSIVDDWEEEKRENHQSGIQISQADRNAREASVLAYIGQSHPSINQVNHKSAHQPVSLKQVLSIPTVAYSCVIPVVALGCISFLSAQLEIAFGEQHDMNDVQISGCFLLLSFIQLLACPLAGYVSDKMSPKLPMIGGLSLMSLAMFMIGPTPLWLNSQPNLNVQLPGLALLGLGGSFAIIPTFTDQLKASTHLGRFSQPLIAGLSAGAFSLGEVVGPIVGSALVESYTFETACTIVGMTCLLIAVLGIVLISRNIIPWDYEPHTAINQSSNESTNHNGHNSERVIEMENINTSMKQSINQSIQKGKQMVDRLRAGRRGYGKMGSVMIDDDEFEDEIIDEFDDRLVDDQVYEMDAIDAPALSHHSINHAHNQRNNQPVAMPPHLTQSQSTNPPAKRSVPLIASPELSPELELDDDEDQDIDIVVDHSNNPSTSSPISLSIDQTDDQLDDDENETSLFDGDEQYS